MTSFAATLIMALALSLIAAATFPVHIPVAGVLRAHPLAVHPLRPAEAFEHAAAVHPDAPASAHSNHSPAVGHAGLFRVLRR